MTGVCNYAALNQWLAKLRIRHLLTIIDDFTINVAACISLTFRFMCRCNSHKQAHYCQPLNEVGFAHKMNSFEYKKTVNYKDYSNIAKAAIH